MAQRVTHARRPHSIPSLSASQRTPPHFHPAGAPWLQPFGDSTESANQSRARPVERDSPIPASPAPSPSSQSKTAAHAHRTPPNLPKTGSHTDLAAIHKCRAPPDDASTRSPFVPAKTQNSRPHARNKSSVSSAACQTRLRESSPRSQVASRPA